MSTCSKITYELWERASSSANISLEIFYERHQRTHTGYIQLVRRSVTRQLNSQQ